MKFGQLIEYNVRNFFLQKSYRKWAKYWNLLSFLIKPFSYMIKNYEQKLKYLKNEKSF